MLLCADHDAQHSDGEVEERDEDGGGEDQDDDEDGDDDDEDDVEDDDEVYCALINVLVQQIFSPDC